MNRHRHPAATSRAIAALGVAALLALAACGGDDDTDSPAPDTSATSPSEATHPSEHTTVPPDESADEPADPAGENVIVISGFAFSGVTEVPVGTTVRVVNEDTAAHTWTAADGAFDSGGLAPGESFEFTFDTAGSYDFLCRIHPEMTGTIVVTA